MYTAMYEAMRTAGGRMARARRLRAPGACVRDARWLQC